MANYKKGKSFFFFLAIATCMHTGGDHYNISTQIHIIYFWGPTSTCKLEINYKQEIIACENVVITCNNWDPLQQQQFKICCKKKYAVDH